tara:strand:+ start:423 stop:1418 length:996 start_codon:yes stop_codon:yes gene_type:complete
MCDPVTIGVATFAVGTISTVANFQQQNAAAAAADEQAYNQVLAQNQAAQQQAAFNQQQAFFQMEQQNAQIELANQRSLNEWILNTQQTNTANARIQREFMMAQQQRNFTNLQNQLQFQAQLNEAILSENRADNQKKLNQLNLNSDLEASQNKRNQAKALRAFEAERLMASVVQSQGTILASGRSGQSIGLGVLNEGAKYGRDMRMAERNYSMALGDFYAENTNAFLKKAQTDADAMARVKSRPTAPLTLPQIAAPVFSKYAPKPVFAKFMNSPGPIQGPTYAPMYTPAARPGALGLVAGIGGAALSGVTAGYQMDALINRVPAPTPTPTPP